MKIVFIVGSVSDSHITKRIEAFCVRGFRVEVYGYTRDLNFSNKIKGLTPTVIGKLTNGVYFNRILSGFKDISAIIKTHSDDTLYYIWGFDIGLVHLFRNTKYIYEISDIRYANFMYPLNALFKYLDRRIISKSIYTPITSEGFIEWIGHKESLSDKYVLMPNKLSPLFREIKRDAPVVCSTKRIRVAYAGMYRYPNTVLKMAQIIGEKFRDNYEFHFWGKGDKEISTAIDELTRNYDNVYEHGPFRNPDDLKMVYDSFDIVACNYDTNGVNERIAEPNKFYESIFFNKPLIVTENTFLSKKVKSLGIGFETNNTEDSIIKLLESLTREQIASIAKKEYSIKDEELIEDYDELWKVIER